jgi:hypothetical protein
VRLDNTSEPETDIAILRPRADFSMTAHPGPTDVLLVIEVADTSLAYDLGTKVPLYARHRIPEARVIDAATRRTRVFRQPVGRGEASRSAGSGYDSEVIIEPPEAITRRLVHGRRSVAEGREPEGLQAVGRRPALRDRGGRRPWPHRE